MYILTLALSFLCSTFFISVVLTIVGGFGLLYLFMVRNFGVWEKKYGIKGMKPVAFLGTESDILMGRKNLNAAVLDKYDYFDGHKFGIIYQGAKPTIFVRDIELLKNICFSHFEHFANFNQDGLENIADHNLFFTQGEKWRVSKAALSQVFRTKNVKDALPKLTKCIIKNMIDLDSYAKTEEEFRFDDRVIESCLLDAVGQAVLGVNIDAVKDYDSELFKMVRLLQSSIWRFFFSGIFPELMAFLRIKMFHPTATSYLDKLLRQLLADHKKSKKYDDMMGVHLKVKEEVEQKTKSGHSEGDESPVPLTDEMILSSCMQFFFDAVLTIATMINVAVFHLANNEEMQEKAYDEIQTVMGDRMYPESGNNVADYPEITDNDLAEMKYIDQMFSEASRLGAFPFITRNCTKAYKLPDSDLVIPKGTPVYIPILGFHMDPKYWADPEKFIPERFALENKDKIIKGTFCPFGQGPRMCLGMNFIRMEGRAYLANLIRLYKIQPSNKTTKSLDWDLEGSGRIKGGIFIKVIRRDVS